VQAASSRLAAMTAAGFFMETPWKIEGNG